MGVCNCSMFCFTLLYVHSSFAIIFMGKRELVVLLSLYTLKRSTALCCRSLDGRVVSGLLIGSFECSNTGCFQNTVPE